MANLVKKLNDLRSYKDNDYNKITKMVLVPVGLYTYKMLNMDIGDYILQQIENDNMCHISDFDNDLGKMFDFGVDKVKQCEYKVDKLLSYPKDEMINYAICRLIFLNKYNNIIMEVVEDEKIMAYYEYDDRGNNTYVYTNYVYKTMKYDENNNMVIYYDTLGNTHANIKHDDCLGRLF